MKYIYMLRVNLRKNMIYKASCIIDIVVAMVTIIILKFFWQTMYADSYEQYRYMLNYAVFTNIISVIYNVSVYNSLINKIRTGDICIDLVRPWNVITSLFFEEWGIKLSKIVTDVIPVSLICVLFFQIQGQTPVRFLLLCVSVFLSSVILFLVKICVSMICFWIMEAWSLLLLVDTIVLVLSGKFVPSWLMPEFFQQIMKCFPFIWIYQKPVELYLSDQFSAMSLLALFGMYLFWILLLLLVTRIIWGRAANKMIVQGG